VQENKGQNHKLSWTTMLKETSKLKDKLFNSNTDNIDDSIKIESHQQIFNFDEILNTENPLQAEFTQKHLQAEKILQDDSVFKEM
jgi:hypothetical protein